MPEVIVSITRITVSLFPPDDISHRDFALHIELKQDGWVLHNGHEFYTSEGGWEPSQSLAHRFTDYEDAIALARDKAPDISVDGHTAIDKLIREQGDQ